jgi:hypothetical protein
VNAEAFSVADLRAWVEARLRSVSGETWHEVGERLGRWAYWEFEDYQF